jgi:hypothetical protein
LCDALLENAIAVNDKMISCEAEEGTLESNSSTLLEHNKAVSCAIFLSRRCD